MSETGMERVTGREPDLSIEGDSLIVRVIRSRRIPFLLVICSSLASVLAAILSFNNGYEGVFHHVFYIPVILACIFYGFRGFFISGALILFYAVHMLIFYHGEPLMDIMIHVLNFLLIAAVISYIIHKADNKFKKASVEISRVLQDRLKYRILLDELTDPVFTVSRDGQLLYINKAFAKITGQSLDFFRGRNIWNMLPGDNTDERVALVDHVIREGVETSLVMRVPVQGKIRHYLTTLSPVKDAGGSVDYIISFGKDITERIRAEAALKTSLENLRRSQEMGRLADWRMDLVTGIYSGSDVGYDILGFDHDEVITREKIRPLYEPSDAVKAGDAMRHALETNGTYSIVSRIHRKNDGELRYILSISQVETDSSGRPVALFGINQDITEQIKTEEALRESEELNRIITGLTTDYAYIVDVTPDKKISLRWVSENMPELTGRSKEEITDFDSWKRIFHPEDYEKFTAFMWKILGNCEAGVLETRSVRSDGEQRWINVYAFPKKADNGAIVVYGAVKDITGRKKAEEEVMRFKFMVENAKQEIYLVRSGGEIAYVNRAAADSLGYTVGELLKMNVADFDPKYGPVFRQYYEELNSDNLSLRETVHIAKDGRRIIKEINSVTLMLDDVEYVCGFGMDITERKRAEEERRKLQEQLAQSQKMESVGRLAGGVAHDFNNMLGVIIGQAELALMKCEQTGRVHDSLREIEKAARRSADLTGQLLAFARKQAVAPRVIDLNETIAGMISMLRRLIGEDIELQWAPGGELWYVKMDPAQVDQILANLCVNARDAISGTGRIMIKTENTTLDEAWCEQHSGFYPGDFVILTVSDTGSGFKPEILSHVFEPFFTTKELGKGTGLGLAMVYGIVKQNRGFIDLMSREGEGARFSIYLPRSDDRISGEDVSMFRETPETGSETILLVEDEPMLLDMTRSMLEDLGYSVIATSSPAEAVNIAIKHGKSIKLLITDVIMPGVNGHDLSVRLLDVIPGLSRLFMSGYTLDVIAHHGVLEEGVHFIQKPFSLKDLSARVRHALGHEEARPG